jgi:regulator of protease activity HflC (stomatin/prohibitin superfamily)
MATSTEQLKGRTAEWEAEQERKRKRAEAKRKAAAAAAKKKKKAQKEKVSAGRDDSQANYERLSAGLRARLATARGAGNQKMVTDLEARLKALKETVK